MANKALNQDLFVVCSVNQQLLAVPVDTVREMVPLPRVVAVPKTPAHVRGVINLRGTVMPLFDLRCRLGFQSAIDERQGLTSMLKEREQDHLDWLSELESVVEEGREFNLATDPHQCAFGKWYYAYQGDAAARRHLYLDSVLKRFEEPHSSIHGVAEKALALCDSGDQDAARALIQRARSTTLAELIELFKETYRVLDETWRELVMVIGSGGRPAAMTVDTVEAVEKIARADGVSAVELGVGADDPLISAVGKRGADQTLVLLLDPDEFCQAAEGLALSGPPAS